MIRNHALHEKVINASLILYEHEFNASTHCESLCPNTIRYPLMCYCAIGSLRGSLHGGANEAAMEMISGWNTVEQVEVELLENYQTKKKLGFWHAIYRESDPRNDIIKEWSKNYEESANKSLFEVSERVDKIMWREKKLFLTLTFIMHQLIITWVSLLIFTPIFVCSRVTADRSCD